MFNGSSAKLGYGVAVGLVGTLGLRVAYRIIYGPNLSSTFLQSKIEKFPLKLESGRYLLNFTGENGLTKLTKQVYFNKRTAKKDAIKVILLEFNKTISNMYSKITGKRRRHLGICLWNKSLMKIGYTDEGINISLPSKFLVYL